MLPGEAPQPISASHQSRQAAEYVPSGFPGGGGYGAQAFPSFGVPSPAFNGANPSAGATAGLTRGDVRGLHGSAGAGAVHSDSAAAAEWRALYGASTDMLNATAGAFRAGTAGISFMTPIFHLTAHDATILSMEHNNHCKLLGISTSKNEILVTWTQLMPVIENMGALRAADDDLFGGEQAPPVDERLLEWDPATMSILIDELPYPCTELSWAPWQQGIYLAGLCPGHGIRIYRYSHGHWALDDCIRTTESSSCAISKNFTVACACSRGRVELWSRGAAAGVVGAGQPSSGASGATATATGHAAGVTANSSFVGSSSGSAWVLCRTLTLPTAEEEEAHAATVARSNESGVRGVAAAAAAVSASAAGRHRSRDIGSVGWDESGALLAVGSQGGSVHVIAVSQDSTRFGDILYHLPPSDGAGPCRQVAWAPSSGRSFLSLAMVFSNCVRVVLFRRPRFMSAAGLPHATPGSRLSSSAASAAATGAALLVLATALVPCEEVARLSWNGTGTRFVTSHLDSSVNIWAVDVRYQYQARSDIANTRSSSGGEGGTPGPADAVRSPHLSSEKRLSLVVSVRRTSSVHPYHAVSK